MPRPALIPVAVAAAAVLAASAHASRKASAVEQGAMSKTISAYVRSKTPEVTRFQIRSARISTVDQTWAAVRIEAWRRSKDLGPVTVVLHDVASPAASGGNGHGHANGKGNDNGNGQGNGKHDQQGSTTTTTTTTTASTASTAASSGKRSWHVVAFGSVSLGCGLPPAVQADLHLACN